VSGTGRGFETAPLRKHKRCQQLGVDGFDKKWTENYEDYDVIIILYYFQYHFRTADKAKKFVSS
jgi:hypothetical protein